MVDDGTSDDAKRHRKVADLFLRASELPPEQRPDFLCRACGSDDTLRSEIERLLERDESDQPTAELRPVIPELRELTETSAPEVPDSIGPYRLLQVLGEGGMGTVYLAEQKEPIRRRVALKVIKRGMDTDGVIARFEAERQALALMNHPNVAKVFDAGATEHGRPYFAMELVKGDPITTYCDKQRLNTEERLRLFAKVCQGLQHAHRKGIIHRDIKPSNVLVTIEEEQEPTPKIIDFGVAKATAQRLTERTVFTEYGQVIGTPEYMSPEQAEMTVQDVDVRTDVYSLGVLLYELLVGALPFDPKELRQAGFDEIRRRIREEEPSKPSKRISVLGSDSSVSARNRKTDPQSLVKRLRGDLDWIVMKALEKDRARRYATAEEFASDVARHLGAEPVRAGPPTLGRKTRRLVIRNRLMIIMVTAVALLVSLGGVRKVYVSRKQVAEETAHLTQLLHEITSAGPSVIADEPDWKKLRKRLRTTVSRNPESDLAELALQAGASARAWISMNVGTTLQPPFLFIMSGHRFNPEQNVVYLARYEASWCGGPWKPVAFESYPSGTGGRDGPSAAVTMFADPDDVDVGEHVIAVRGVFDIVRLDDVPVDLEGERGLEELSKGIQWAGEESRDQFAFYRAPSPPQAWSRIESSWRVTRSLGEFGITLLERFPPDFPRNVPPGANRTFETWFAVNRLIVLRAGEGDGACKRVHSRRGIESFFSAPRAVVGLELEGRFDLRGVPPLAARVDAYRSGDYLPLVSFPLYFGAGRAGPKPYSQEDPGLPGRSQDLGEFMDIFNTLSKGSQWSSWRRNAHMFRSTMFVTLDGQEISELGTLGTRGPSVPETLPATVEDAIVEGHLELFPSRETAKATWAYDQFDGDLRSIPVTIEIQTLDALCMEAEVHR